MQANARYIQRPSNGGFELRQHTESSNLSRNLLILIHLCLVAVAI